ncbi:MAG: hypothetical protein ACPLSA_00715 [Caldanaerobacter sp.]|uniref:hypothetical protein n=1 Tax=Caldanaerobacter sp. TaxID=2930036 RepID=UPI003C75834B
MSDKLAFSLSILVILLSLMWFAVFKRPGGEFTLVLVSIGFALATIGLVLLSNRSKRRK